MEILRANPLTKAEAGLLGSYLGKRRAHERFIYEMAPALVEAAAYVGIDPVGMMMQAAKETAYGHFGGLVLPEFHNTCGLKVRYNNTMAVPYDHDIFGDWSIGAYAHAVHLWAYTHTPEDEYPPFANVDGRLIWVIGKPPVEHWHELGGLWAPAASYGHDIEKMITDVYEGR